MIIYTLNAISGKKVEDLSPLGQAMMASEFILDLLLLSMALYGTYLQ